jgi:hypothetical protein
MCALIVAIVLGVNYFPAGDGVSGLFIGEGPKTPLSAGKIKLSLSENVGSVLQKDASDSGAGETLPRRLLLKFC